MLCCGYTLTDFPISVRLTSLALWQSNDCPSASKATLMNMDKLFMWIHYERLHNHNKAKHNKTVCIFLGIYCTLICVYQDLRRYIVWLGHNKLIHKADFRKVWGSLTGVLSISWSSTIGLPSQLLKLKFWISRPENVISYLIHNMLTCPRTNFTGKMPKPKFYSPRVTWRPSIFHTPQ